MDQRRVAGLDSFWEEADSAGSEQDPLERELVERSDALARCRRRMVEAEEQGREDLADILLREYEREAAILRRLRGAMAERPRQR